ncbi:MAG: MFS transporter [Coriobacteriia bacterium]|nr:MFS transporter [Coriobacteriia bacterium]
MSAIHEHTTEEPLTCVPGAVRPGAVLTVLVAGTILAPLDASIVNIALPSMAAQFDVRLTLVSWVTTAYLLTSAALLLSMGRLGDVWGLRRLYIAGLIVFGVGSLACAVSPSIGFLIAARVLQASGSAMLFAAGPALVTRTFPPNRRGWALGYIALAVSLGLTAGPALGGVLVGTWGWPSIFIINLPIVAVVTVMSWRLLPDECPAGGRFDIPGALLSGMALFLVLIGLGGADRAGLISPAVIGPVAVGLLLGAVFVWWEHRAIAPMVDMAIFRVRAFSAGITAATLAYLALFAVTFTMPFYLVRVHGFDARIAGLVLTATPITMAVLAPIAGRRSDRKGSRTLATAGIAVLGGGLFIASFLEEGTPIALIVAALVVVGSGMAVFQTPNTSAVLRATPRSSSGVGSAFVAEARNVGMSLGIALTAAIVSAAVGAQGLPGGEGPIPEAVATAFVGGMSTALRVAAVIALGGAAVSWFGREADPVEGVGVKH